MFSAPIKILLVLAFAFSATAHGRDLDASPEKIRIGYSSFPPYTYADESGRATGTLNELTRQALRTAGIPHEFIQLPAKRIARYIQTGQIDLVQGLSTHPTFKDKVLVSKSVLATIQLMVYHLPETPAIDSYLALSNASVVTMLGYSYGAIGVFVADSDNNVMTLPVRERESAYGVLAKGRADYLLDYREPARTELGEQRLASLVEKPLLALPTHWVVRKSYPESERLLAALDASYQVLARGEAGVLAFKPACSGAVNHRLCYPLHLIPQDF